MTYLLLISKLVTESLLAILDFEAEEAACGTDETEAGGEVVAGSGVRRRVPPRFGVSLQCALLGSESSLSVSLRFGVLR